HPRGGARDVGMMPESFPLVHIGNVDFDDRALKGTQRIEDGDRRMGEGGGIDDDCGGAPAGAVNPVNDLVFAIALVKLDREPKFCSDAATIRFDIGKRLAAIDLGLALAEQIEIGTVQAHDDRIHALPPATADLVPQGAAKWPRRTVQPTNALPATWSILRGLRSR